MHKLSPKEIEAVLALSAEARYEYLIKRVCDCEEIWSLAGDGGWSLMSDGGTEIVPVWPHPDFARLCATGSFAHDKPAAISLDDWLERWCPGMDRDGRKVAVFPRPDLGAAVVHPDALAEDLRGYLRAWFEE